MNDRYLMTMNVLCKRGRNCYVWALSYANRSNFIVFTLIDGREVKVKLTR